MWKTRIPPWDLNMTTDLLCFERKMKKMNNHDVNIAEIEEQIHWLTKALVEQYRVMRENNLDKAKIASEKIHIDDLAEPTIELEIFDRPTPCDFPQYVELLYTISGDLILETDPGVLR